MSPPGVSWASCIYNPSTQEAKAEGSQVGSQAGMYRVWKGRREGVKRKGRQRGSEGKEGDIAGKKGRNGWE